MQNWIKEASLVLVVVVSLFVLAWAARSLWLRFNGDGAQLPAGPRLDDVIVAIKQQLVVAEKQQAFATLPQLQRVKVELQVQLESTQGGELAAKVVPADLQGGGKGRTARTLSQTLKIELRPPPRSVTQESVDLAGLDLATAIVEVARGLANSSAQQPRLDATKVEIEVLFSVAETRGTTAGVDLKVIKATAEDESEKTRLQRVTLVFAPPEAEKEATWE